MRKPSGWATSRASVPNTVLSAVQTTLLASKSLIVKILIAALAAIVLAEAAVMRVDSVHAAAFGYLCRSIVFVICGVTFLPHAWAAKAPTQMRWYLMAGGAIASAAGFALSFTDLFQVTTGPAAKPFQIAFFNLGEAQFLLAIVLFFAGSARSVVLVDLLQAFLFAFLRFNLTYTTSTADRFRPEHLFIGQLVACLLFLVAAISCSGATSSAERKLLRTLTLFFGVRFLMYILSNQVSYVWLHFSACSPLDALADAFLGGFAVYLLRMRRSEQPDGVIGGFLPQRPTLAVRNVMPAFLALVNLFLALLTEHISTRIAYAALALAIALYIARTVLLQGQSARERAVLVSRNEQLEGLATCDPLTGIGNRRSLNAMYSRLQATAADTSLAILLMDIDHFKQANDRHGHLHGDKVLISLANQLQSSTAAITGSHCARFGGDEFAVLLPGISSQAAAEIAQEIRLTFFAQALQAGDKKVTLSMGVALLSAAHELSLEALISYADAALYRAKLLGRNRVEVQKLYDLASIAETATTPRQELSAQR